MGKKVFDLSALKVLENGKTIAALDKHIQRLATDCYDRPGDRSKRSVTLQIDIIPLIGVDGSVDKVEAQASVKSNVPPHRTNPFQLGLTPGGKLIYNEFAAENADQATFAALDGDEDEEEV